MVSSGVSSTDTSDTSEMTLTAHKATTDTSQQPGTGYASRASETEALKAGTVKQQLHALLNRAPTAATQPSAETVKQLIKNALKEGIKEASL